jgi:metal-responsive CopG/Arc/MetJ family transcriptional regulator
LIFLFLTKNSRIFNAAVRKLNGTDEGEKIIAEHESGALLLFSNYFEICVIAFLFTPEYDDTNELVASLLSIKKEHRCWKNRTVLSQSLIY